MPICGARNKTCRKCGHRYSKNEYELWQCPECDVDRHCQQRVKTDGQRCRMHGGGSLKGAAAPAFKTGRYSRYLPARLVERYQTSLADGDLLALRDEVALVDARLSELLLHTETGEGQTAWERLELTYTQLKHAQAKRDVEKVATTMNRIGEIIEGHEHTDEIWREIYGLLEWRRKLVESERKRLVEMQQMITVEQAMVLLAQVQQVILDHVSDRTILNSIAAEFRRIAVAEVGG